MVPYSRKMVSHPFTVPGTDTAKALVFGILVCPALMTSSIAAAAGARPLAFVSNAALLEPLQDLLEVIEFFPGEGRHGLQEKAVVRILEEQLHGGTGGLLLAMRVIQQHRVEVIERALDPVRRGRRSQVQHGLAV